MCHEAIRVFYDALLLICELVARLIALTETCTNLEFPVECTPYVVWSLQAELPQSSSAAAIEAAETANLASLANLQLLPWGVKEDHGTLPSATSVQARLRTCCKQLREAPPDAASSIVSRLEFLDGILGAFHCITAEPQTDDALRTALHCLVRASEALEVIRQTSACMREDAPTSPLFDGSLTEFVAVNTAPRPAAGSTERLNNFAQAIDALDEIVGALILVIPAAKCYGQRSMMPPASGLYRDLLLNMMSKSQRDARRQPYGFFRVCSNASAIARTVGFFCSSLFLNGDPPKELTAYLWGPRIDTQSGREIPIPRHRAEECVRSVAEAALRCKIRRSASTGRVQPVYVPLLYRVDHFETKLAALLAERRGDVVKAGSTAFYRAFVEDIFARRGDPTLWPPRTSVIDKLLQEQQHMGKRLIASEMRLRRVMHASTGRKLKLIGASLDPLSLLRGIHQSPSSAALMRVAARNGLHTLIDFFLRTTLVEAELFGTFGLPLLCWVIAVLHLAAATVATGKSEGEHNDDNVEDTPSISRRVPTDEPTSYFLALWFRLLFEVSSRTSRTRFHNEEIRAIDACLWDTSIAPLLRKLVPFFPWKDLSAWLSFNRGTYFDIARFDGDDGVDVSQPTDAFFDSYWSQRQKCLLREPCTWQTANRRPTSTWPEASRARLPESFLVCHDVWRDGRATIPKRESPLMTQLRQQFRLKEVRPEPSPIDGVGAAITHMRETLAALSYERPVCLTWLAGRPYRDMPVLQQDSVPMT